MSREFVTERLTVRPFAMGDLEEVHRLIYSDCEVCRHFCGATRTLEQTREWLAYRVGQAVHSSFCAWAVVRRGDGRLLGEVLLDAYPNRWYRLPEEPAPPYNAVEVELGFAFGREFWGQGYAGEACRAVIAYAFDELRLPRLLGGASYDNPRSAALQRRLGYRLERNANPDYPEWVSVLENPRGPASQRKSYLTYL